ncbi:plasmid segregation protein ParM [Marininema mesophilum]|uniref:Plasmid segregation protein ParM n=1 Tax=Marininema mesophilum TaxID=1048340 RepID=A0A1H3BRK9_9BACL|nr:hypothetical protein [Marininema mesophilum]SDX44622.1 plasmid segregation protein ParM [Marininema mesophilum]
MILGIDPGNEKVKVYGGVLGNLSFPSDLGEWRELRLTNRLTPNDMVWEYEGRRGFAGTLAQAESEWGGTVKGTTKAHDDGKMRVLLGIHRIIPEYQGGNLTVRIVTCQPICQHTSIEKEKIINMLIGSHDLTINGIRKVFRIQEVRVAAEGAAVGLFQPVQGLLRVLDIGSATVNGATIKDMRYGDRESFTEPMGLATAMTVDPKMVARRIQAIASGKRWYRNDLIRLVGGGAVPMADAIREHFPKAYILSPYGLLPEFANAVALHEIGRAIYGQTS